MACLGTAPGEGLFPQSPNLGTAPGEGLPPIPLNVGTDPGEMQTNAKCVFHHAYKAHLHVREQVVSTSLVPRGHSLGRLGRRLGRRLNK